MDPRQTLISQPSSETRKVRTCLATAVPGGAATTAIASAGGAAADSVDAAPLGSAADVEADEGAGRVCAVVTVVGEVGVTTVAVVVLGD